MMDVAKPLYVAKLRRARAAWVFDLRPVTLVFATIVLISVTSMLYLTQASRVAATGYDISRAEDRRARLERRQQVLLADIAKHQSLKRIEAEATAKLGMAPAPPPQYLRVRAPAVDVDAAVQRAEHEAQHLPRTWRERLAAAMRLSSAR
ncbi:MAG: cell division protein FtsL [Chloroflexi bacterium]|nr:cell division protein FtsL [Chloroflexota bacterium]